MFFLQGDNPRLNIINHKGIPNDWGYLIEPL